MLIEQSRGRVAAFSLVEIVAVMMIMGLMFAIAQPKLAGFVQRDRVRRAGSRVAMDLRRVQAEAIKRRSPARVVFDDRTDTYVAWVRDSSAHSGWLPIDLCRSGRVEDVDVTSIDELPPGAVVNLADDVDFRVAVVSADFDKDSQVTFNEYGVPTAASGGQVVLGVGTLRITVSVNGATGQVSVGDLVEVKTKVAPLGGMPEHFGRLGPEDDGEEVGEGGEDAPGEGGAEEAPGLIKAGSQALSGS